MIPTYIWLVILESDIKVKTWMSLNMEHFFGVPTIPKDICWRCVIYPFLSCFLNILGNTNNKFRSSSVKHYLNRQANYSILKLLTSTSVINPRKMEIATSGLFGDFCESRDNTTLSSSASPIVSRCKPRDSQCCAALFHEI